jgi:prepilin-type N-terminal cleavage/methylation domain-containing protein
MRSRSVQRGFTLVELVLVIVITGILATVAFRTAGTLSETARTEETKQELDALACAIVGNPELQTNGTRSDFGYVGDVGAMPSDLDALYANPGVYTTWKGPYIGNHFTQIADDYKKDAWGDEYEYAGGVTIRSNGSGIVRKLAIAMSDLLQNEVNGVVYDLDGTPPGSIYHDSVAVHLIVPDGGGGMVTRATTPDDGGYFSFTGIPIGNHTLNIIYLPDSDTLTRFVAVLPNSSLFSEYYLPSEVWSDSP